MMTVNGAMKEEIDRQMKEQKRKISAMEIHTKCIKNQLQRAKDGLLQAQTEHLKLMKQLRNEMNAAREADQRVYEEKMHHINSLLSKKKDEVSDLEVTIAINQIELKILALAAESSECKDVIVGKIIQLMNDHMKQCLGQAWPSASTEGSSSDLEGPSEQHAAGEEFVGNIEENQEPNEQLSFGTSDVTALKKQVEVIAAKSEAQEEAAQSRLVGLRRLMTNFEQKIRWIRWRPRFSLRFLFRDGDRERESEKERMTENCLAIKQEIAAIEEESRLKKEESDRQAREILNKLELLGDEGQGDTKEQRKKSVGEVQTMILEFAETRVEKTNAQHSRFMQTMNKLLMLNPDSVNSQERIQESMKQQQLEFEHELLAGNKGNMLSKDSSSSTLSDSLSIKIQSLKEQLKKSVAASKQMEGTLFALLKNLSSTLKTFFEEGTCFICQSRCLWFHNTCSRHQEKVEALHEEIQILCKDLLLKSREILKNINLVEANRTPFMQM